MMKRSFVGLAFLATTVCTAAAAPPAELGPQLQQAPTPQQVRFDRRSPVVLAVERVKGAVVNISSTRLVKVRYGPFDDDLFSRYFGDDDPFSRTVQSTSLGSGVIIHPAGYVLTNAHVIARATEVSCAIVGADGKDLKFEAKIISSDPAQDLAVLKIDTPDGKPLPFLPMGRSDNLLIGETVIAIGNAMGYSHSVTTGVVSAVGRQIKLSDELALTNLVQTDASINPGNSGGPLLNVNGELIGINTAIRGDAQNIGFAIPIDNARKEVAFLLDFERINELVFGGTLDDRDGRLRISAVKAKTPADAAGLRVGDVVEAVDGKPCNSLLDFNVLLLDSKPDQVRRLSIIRTFGGATTNSEVKIKLVAAPKPDGNELIKQRFGLTVAAVGRAKSQELGLRPGVGLIVTEIERDSYAQRIGLQVGDILFAVDKLMVNSADQLGQALKKVQPGEVVRMGFLRGRYQIWTRLKAK